MKQSILAMILIGILALSGCKAVKEEKVASAAGLVVQTEAEQQDTILLEKAEEQPNVPEEEVSAPKSEKEEESVPRKLTVEDVLALSKKGESLSYKDFDGYLFEEEPDRELRVYKIDEQYWVEVRYSEIEETTQSILLYANDVSPTMVVDLRGGNVADFVAEHENAAILATVDAEWTRVSDMQSFTDFYQYAEKNGKVRYYEFEGEVVTPNKIIGAFVRFDTLEAYRAYAGEQADAKYDADFFKEKTLIILDSGYGVGNASRIQVGKQGKTLYISGLDGLGHIYATPDVMIYSLFCLEIPKDQLTDVETEEIRRMNFQYFTDYER